MEITSQYITGCSIKPPESLPPMLMVEPNKNEDMIKNNEYLEEAKKMNGGKKVMQSYPLRALDRRL